MYTFEQKNEIIIRLASEEYFEKDKTLFYRHCSNAKLERDVNRANQFTYATLDARILNEVLNHVTEADIIANRKGSEVGKSKKKTAAKKKSGKITSKRGKSPEQKPESKNILPASVPASNAQNSPASDDKKKEAREKNSQE